MHIGSLMKRQRICLVCMGFLIVAVGALIASSLPAAPKPMSSEKRAPSDPVSDKERMNVAALHRNVVEIFVDRPLFGVRRTLPNWFNDIVLPPKTDTESSAQKDQVLTPAKKNAKERDAH